jgi:hypothetical protein
MATKTRKAPRPRGLILPTASKTIPVGDVSPALPRLRAAVSIGSADGANTFVLPSERTTWVLVSSLRPKGPTLWSNTERVHVTRRKALLEFAEVLLMVVFQARKQRNAQFRVLPAPRTFQRETAWQTLSWAPVQNVEGDASPGLLVTAMTDTYRVDHYADHFGEAADAAVEALVNDGWRERPVDGDSGPWKRPASKGIVSFPGGDGSRIDLSFQDGSIERLQLLEAPGVVALRARVESTDRESLLIAEHLEKPKTTAEFKSSAICTASVDRNRGGGLTVLWKQQELSPATPDPSPLPV